MYTCDVLVTSSLNNRQIRATLKVLQALETFNGKLKGMATSDFGSHIWYARTTAWVFFAHFWTGNVQRHMFSDSKVYR